MATRTPGRKVVMTALAALACLAVAPARADDNALAKYVGRWDVRVKNLQPKGPDVTYIENYQWVLRRKFIRATTEGLLGRRAAGRRADTITALEALLELADVRGQRVASPLDIGA